MNKINRILIDCGFSAIIFCMLIAAAKAQSSQQTFEPLPPDLPLPTAPRLVAPWLERAIVLQPWRATQYAALTETGDRPQRLQREFGFNAIIVLPPEANNAGVTPPYRQTDEQFRAGVESYRKAGYKLILYSSVVQSGMLPLWHNGQIEQVHPEWSMRDSRGRPIRKYGHAWLCPNSPALEYSIKYTEKLVRDYRPDAVMLDNNQFFYTEDNDTSAETWTCYCDFCQKKFRDYTVERFGVEGVRRVFRADAAKLTIPTAEGALYALWIHWRNRVWAETNETFRARLRRVEPQIMFFANHQYDWSDGVLSSDLQYEHEDVVLSESRAMASWQMSEKMLIGNALAAGRPLWNYIGTFEEKDYSKLRPKEIVAPIIAAGLAHRARPWIVYFGFQDSQENYPARREMSELLSWYAKNPDLFDGSRLANVGVVVSPLNRNLHRRDLFPSHFKQLVRAKIPLTALRDDRLTAEKLNRFRVVTLENALSMSDATVYTLAEWIRGGGTLITVPDAGCNDELGRRRSKCALWDALKLTNDSKGTFTVERGKVIITDANQLARIAETISAADTFRITPESAVEVIPYQMQGRILIHLIRHEPARGSLTLRLPQTMKVTGSSAAVYAPELESPKKLTITRKGGDISVTIPDAPIYSVIVIE